MVGNNNAELIRISKQTYDKLAKRVIPEIAREGLKPTFDNAVSYLINRWEERKTKQPDRYRRI